VWGGGRHSGISPARVHHLPRGASLHPPNCMQTGDALWSVDFEVGPLVWAELLLARRPPSINSRGRVQVKPARLDAVLVGTLGGAVHSMSIKVRGSEGGGWRGSPCVLRAAAPQPRGVALRACGAAPFPSPREWWWWGGGVPLRVPHWLVRPCAPCTDAGQQVAPAVHTAAHAPG
jgi:hypothetical protein